MKLKRNKDLAIYPGSFDPFHEGHFLVLKNALTNFSKIIILVANNPSKKHRHDLFYRKSEIIRYLENNLEDWRYFVTVKKLNDSKTVPQFANEYKCNFIIRGYRNKDDKKYEKKLKKMYLKFNNKLRFFYFKTLNDISSTKVNNLETLMLDLTDEKKKTDYKKGEMANLSFLKNKDNDDKLKKNKSVVDKKLNNAFMEIENTLELLKQKDKQENKIDKFK